MSTGLQVCCGCLSYVHSPGAEGERAPQAAAAAAESSLTSPWVPLFSLFLFEKFFLLKAPWSKQPPGCSHSPAWLSPKNPAADPDPRGGFSHPGPGAVSRDLIVLKHSSYPLIFQCPLSLVFDLHICWNTIGCSLCSSDQLGVSLVPRRSGLCSHLSCRHLLISGWCLFLTLMRMFLVFPHSAWCRILHCVLWNYLSILILLSHKQE